MKVGRIRYGVLGTDAGRIMDDGTIARLGEDQYYVTTTSTGADTVIEWFEWWNAVWGLDVETINLTGALAAVNIAGPRARELLGRLADIDTSNEGISYLDAKEAFVAGVPCLILRIGFVGELGYELHFSSPYGEFVWDALLEYGADLGIRPFGLEPQRILRLEKMHILVGQDTDSESNVLEAGMPRSAIPRESGSGRERAALPVPGPGSCRGPLPASLRVAPGTRARAHDGGPRPLAPRQDRGSRRRRSDRCRCRGRADHAASSTRSLPV